jgi:hypothetical protein
MKKTLLKLTIFLIILGLIGFYLFRAMDWADKNKNESAAISTMRSITEVQEDFLKLKVSECASLQELLSKGMIDPKLNDGKKAGYDFLLTKSGNICEILATPENSSKGNRSFYSTNQDNWKIHFSEDFDVKANMTHPVLDTRPNY